MGVRGTNFELRVHCTCSISLSNVHLRSLLLGRGLLDGDWGGGSLKVESGELGDGGVQLTYECECAGTACAA